MQVAFMLAVGARYHEAWDTHRLNSLIYEKPSFQVKFKKRATVHTSLLVCYCSRVTKILHSS